MNEKILQKDHTDTLQSLKLFSETHPTFSEGSLRWIIFKFREKLISAQAICYCGSRVLIHPKNFQHFIMEGKARTPS